LRQLHRRRLGKVRDKDRLKAILAIGRLCSKDLSMIIDRNPDVRLRRLLPETMNAEGIRSDIVAMTIVIPTAIQAIW
jgi:hypothetical protein